MRPHRTPTSGSNWAPPSLMPVTPTGFRQGPTTPACFSILISIRPLWVASPLGASFGEGWRGEAAVNVFDSSDFSGNWSYTVPADPGPHASMEGTVRSVAFFANGYYDVPVEGDFTPFVTAGLGYARNTMSDWTRINPDADRATRTFGSAYDNGFAWNVGAGVAWDVDSVMGSGPVKLEVAWRYYDLGSVNGSADPAGWKWVKLTKRTAEFRSHQSGVLVGPAVPALTQKGGSDAQSGCSM